MNGNVLQFDYQIDTESLKVWNQFKLHTLQARPENFFRSFATILSALWAKSTQPPANQIGFQIRLSLSKVNFPEEITGRKPSFAVGRSKHA